MLHRLKHNTQGCPATGKYLGGLPGEMAFLALLGFCDGLVDVERRRERLAHALSTDSASEGTGDRLGVPEVSRKVKGWCQDVRLDGNYGSHLLRKT